MAQRKNSGRIASDHMPQRGPSATKRGPGREHKGGKPGNRLTKARPQRAYVALMAAWASKRITKAKLRDERGAYVLTGRNLPVYGMNAWDRHQIVGWTPGRRVWVAGISGRA